MQNGLIIKGVGGLFEVASQDSVYTCRARGKLRRGDRPMVGDRVVIEAGDGDEAVISEVLPRKNALIRPALANLDMLVILASTAPPQTDVLLVDKVSAIAVYKEIDVLICINKCDVERGEDLQRTYAQAGFPVICVSARTGEGVDALRTRLAGRVGALTGNSGVGKSSLLHCIDPAWGVQVGALSERIGRGRQTTRHVELFALPEGGYIADTPGFSSFDVERLDRVRAQELQYAFPEFEPFLTQCRYTGCSHRVEQGCAVLAAVKEGRIAHSRHESYVTIYDSIKDMKEWQWKQREQD